MKKTFLFVLAASIAFVGIAFAHSKELWVPATIRLLHTVRCSNNG